MTSFSTFHRRCGALWGRKKRDKKESPQGAPFALNRCAPPALVAELA
jgi:hypothetical protein